MQYMLMLYQDEANFEPGKISGEHSAPYLAYAEALVKAGAMVAGDRLQPTASATTIRVADAGTEVLDGPYADTKEQLAGFYIIEVPDLDAALQWAARCPAASQGTIEVRPIWTR